MNRSKYYTVYDEKIMVVAALLIASLILFILTFFIGCGKDGTHAGALGSITYTIPADTVKSTEHNYLKRFADDTTGTLIELQWKTKCNTAGCVNRSAEVTLLENKNNCTIHVILPNDPQNSGTEKDVVGMTDVIVTCQMSSLFDKTLHIRHFHIYADGSAEQI